MPVTKQYAECKSGMQRFIRIVDFTSDWKESPRYIIGDDSECVIEDEIVMIRYGSQSCAKVFRGHKGIIANNMFKINVNDTIVTKDYLYWYLTQKSIYNQLMSSQSSSTMPALTFGILKNVNIRYPEIETQSRIASILSSLDSKIETNNKINAKLEEMAQALFKSWFVDFEPFKDKGMVESELGMIPEGWRVGNAEDFYSINIGKTPPRKEHEWFTNDNNANTWVSISDMGSCGTFISESSEYLTNEAVSKFNVMMVPKNTLLVSFKLTIGRVAIADCELTTNEAIARFMLPKEEYLEYTYLMLKDYNYGALGSTSSIATAVNSKIIKAMRILMPTMDVINDFHKKVNPLLERIRSLQKESSRLSQLRDTLLPKLMSGEIDLDSLPQ